MSVHTDPDTGATITRQCSRRVVENVQLRIPEHLEEMYLSNLRDLVKLTEHLPGDATVQPREYGLDIMYVLEEDSEQSEALAPELAVEAPPARPHVESVPAAGGDTTPVDEVRAVVELIKDATGMSIVAVAELADIPPSSLSSLMAPGYKSRTTRRSTYDKLHRVLDELAAEGAQPTVDGPEDHATDRERDRVVGL